MTILHEIAEVIGTKDAVQLGQALGGARVYFPAEMPLNHPVALAIGVEKAQRLSQRYSGSTVTFPSKRAFMAIRNALIRSQYDDVETQPGMCKADVLAARYGISRRHVFNIRNPLTAA